MKIIVAEASPLYCLGVKIILNSIGVAVQPSFVSSFDELRTSLSDQQDAVMIILDSRLPGLDQADQLKALIRTSNARVLMLSDNKDIAFMRWTSFHGVKGAIAKTADVEELGDAIRTVMEGRSWRYDEEVSVDQWLGQETRLGYALRRLSNQENNVLRFVRSGLRNKQIASEMSLTEHTIKTHMSNILRKLEIENRTQLVVAIQKVEVDQGLSLSA